MSIDFYAIGQRIQKKRKSQNKTQESLAEAISVTVGYGCYVVCGHAYSCLVKILSF